MANREALWGVSEQYGNQVLNTIGGIALYKATNWYRNNYKNIKTGLDVYYAQGNQKKMARFRRNGYKRRRIGRRYGRKRRFYRSKRLAGRVRRISKMLRSKGIRNTEIKYINNFDVQLGNRPTTTLPAQFCFTSQVTQGTGREDRIGAKIFVRKLNLKFQIRANSAATNPETYVRILIIRDKQPASATVGPIYNDLFDFPAPLPTSAAIDQGATTMAFTMQTFKKMNDRIKGRFQWLFDKWVKVSNDEGTGHSTITFNKIINVFKPAYYGDLPSDGDRGPGHIYMYLVSNEGKQSNTAWPDVNYSCRMSFTDV